MWTVRPELDVGPARESGKSPAALLLSQKWTLNTHTHHLFLSLLMLVACSSATAYPPCSLLCYRANTDSSSASSQFAAGNLGWDLHVVGAWTPATRPCLLFGAGYQPETTGRAYNQPSIYIDPRGYSLISLKPLPKPRNNRIQTAALSRLCTFKPR